MGKELNPFRTPSRPSVPVSAPVPTREDPDVQEARDRAKKAAAKTRGRGSTFLTGATGLTGDSGAVEKKKLLGE